MSILNKFFGNGEVRNKYGEYAGRIEHRSENVAHVYDEYGHYNGRIESYGDNVTIYDENGIMVEGGTHYGSSNNLDTYSFVGGSSKRYSDFGEKSESSSAGSYEYGSIYRSDDDDEDSFW